MKLSSPAFEDGGVIPKRFGGHFDNVNPPLRIEMVPDGAVTLVLTMEDPDLPPGARMKVFDHWVVFDIPADQWNIPEAWQSVGVLGRTTLGEAKYMGPRPPDREHRYIFTVYALDAALELPAGSSKDDVLTAMAGHVLESATLTGRYAPQN